MNKKIISLLVGIFLISFASSSAYVINASHTYSATDSASYTFNGQGIGGADAGRFIYVTAGCRTGNQVKLNSLTIGGSAMTRYFRWNQSDGGHGNEVWGLAYPTGTTADFVLTWNDTCSNSGIAVWSAYGVGTSPTFYHNVSRATGTTPLFPQYLNVSAGGIAIAYGNINEAISSPYYLNLTNNFYDNIEGVSSYQTGASMNVTTAYTGYNISCRKFCLAFSVEEYPDVPVININGPSNNTVYLSSSPAILNWTSSAQTNNLTNTSLYFNGGLNQTITLNALTNTTEIYKTLGSGNYSWFVQSCNAIGCTNSSNYSFSVSNWKTDVLAGPLTSTPGATELFFLTLNTTSGLSVTNANFVYNGTIYTADINNYATQINLTKSITIPGLTGFRNYFFNFTLSDSTSGISNSGNLTVFSIFSGNCTTYNQTLYNFTIKDEQNLTQLPSAIVNSSLNVQIYDKTRTTLYSNFSNNYLATNPFAVCLQYGLANSSNYSLDLQVQYWADGYTREFYNIRNDLVTSTDMNTNISLYPLLNTSNQNFKIIYRDASYLPVSNAVIQIQRKYIGEGLFRGVEQPITDSLGQTTAHLELDNVVYTFIVLVNNEVQSTFSNKVAYCQTPTFNECVIELNEISSNVDYSDYANINDLSFTIGYDSATRTISSIFSQRSGSPANMWLNATLFDNFGNTSVCSTSLYSSSGTLSCVVPGSFGNASVIVDIYSDGNLVGKSVISLAQNPTEVYGGSRVAIGLIMVVSWISISLIGVPIVSAIFLLLSLISLVILNIIGSTGIIGAGATILWFIVAIIMIIIRGGNR